MTVVWSFELSVLASRAVREDPNGRGRSVRPPSPKTFSPNNYLAEAAPRAMRQTHGVLGGRNAKGAGAPRGNRNAAGSRMVRQHIRLKRQNDRQRYQLLALAAAIAHLEAGGKSHFSSNNYLAFRASGLAALAPGQTNDTFERLAPQHDGIGLMTRALSRHPEVRA